MVRSLKRWKIWIVLMAAVPLVGLKAAAGLARPSALVPDQAAPLAQASGDAEPRDSVMVQCNALSNVVNQAAEEAKRVAAPGGDQIAKLAEAADFLDQYALELEGVPLSDPQLEGFKQRFIQMYRGTSQASRQLIAAVERRDSAAGQAALGDLQAATSGESALVAEVNAYCGADR